MMSPPCSSTIEPSVCCIDEFEFLEFDTEEDLSYFSLWDQQSRDAASKHQQLQQQKETTSSRRSSSLMRTLTPTTATRRSSSTRNNPSSSKRLRSTNSNNVSSQRLPSSIEQEILIQYHRRTTTRFTSSQPTLIRASHRQQPPRHTTSSRASSTTSTSNNSSIRSSSSSSSSTTRSKNSAANRQQDASSTQMADIGATATRALRPMTRSNQRGQSNNDGNNQFGDMFGFGSTRKNSSSDQNKVIKDYTTNTRRRSLRRCSRNKINYGELQDDSDMEIDQMEKEIRSILAAEAIF